MMKSFDWKIIAIVTSILFLSSFHGQSFGRNLQLIDSLPNGFKLYRSGEPSKGDLERFHKLGIREIAVLSGDAEDHELKYSDLAPNLEVVYDTKQDSHEPLTVSFLEWFDRWVDRARLAGKVIAFRCTCGCHRTGRLAAYYQMKYQNLTSSDAIVIMNEYGKQMFLHRDLKHQVRALEDYIRGRPCAQEAKHCVIDDRESTRTGNRTGED